jgi:peptidyl-prolyl cis-trans isomerase A (cyclophilin A)
VRAPTLAEALAGLALDQSLNASLQTTEGDIACTLTAARTPRGVAMFVGLARGRAAWREPGTGREVTRPLYHDLPFFRAIPNMLVQSGCPIGNGTGSPGYRIPVEARSDDRARLARPGALLLARYTAPPKRVDPEPPRQGQLIGSQFVITLADMQHLAGNVTVIGACSDLAIVQRIAQQVSAHVPVRLRAINFPAPRDSASRREPATPH